MTKDREFVRVHAKTPAQKRLAHQEVKERYAAAKGGGSPLLTSLRLGELYRLLKRRCGDQLPDDDAGREYFVIVAQHFRHRRSGQRERIARYAAISAPWLTDVEVSNITDDVMAELKMWTADALGAELRLTEAERTTLGIRTIGAYDDSKVQRIERERVKDMMRKRKSRAANSSGKPSGRPKKTPSGIKLRLPIPLMTDGVISPKHRFVESGCAIKAALEHSDRLHEARGRIAPRRRMTMYFGQFTNGLTPIIMLRTTIGKAS